MKQTYIPSYKTEILLFSLAFYTLFEDNGHEAVWSKRSKILRHARR